ncbi:MAG TPA: sigma-70 family RNA polymerase sigma factor [Enhygromyxa sp.]|nr:sigma-70 family RNA polymerase sigma factor [Enhygromyxa sp.]
MSPPLNEAQAARVERHTGLVRDIARRVVRNVGTRMLTVEELESVGNEALVQAAMRYDPSSPASFATYAHYRVYGAMIDALRKRTPSRRSHQRAVVRLAATQDLLRQAAEDHAGQRAAGQQLTLEQRVELARDLVRKATLAVRLSEPEPRSFDSVAAEQPDPEQLLLDADQRRRLWTLVAELDTHERDLIDALYMQGRTMKDYAEAIGTSVSTISRRHARIVGRLSKRMLPPR